MTCVCLLGHCRWTVGALKEAVVVNPSIPSLLVIPYTHTHTHMQARNKSERETLCRRVDISWTVDEGTVRISVNATFRGVCPVCVSAGLVRVTFLKPQQ